MARLERCPGHRAWVVLEGAAAAGLHVHWPNESREDSRLAGRGVRWREQRGDVGKGVARACVHGRVSILASTIPSLLLMLKQSCSAVFASASGGGGRGGKGR